MFVLIRDGRVTAHYPSLPAMIDCTSGIPGMTEADREALGLFELKGSDLVPGVDFNPLTHVSVSEVIVEAGRPVVQCRLSPRGISEVRQQLRVEAAERRWQIEVGGCKWGDIAIATDREAQMAVTGAVVAGQAFGEWPPAWKCGDGIFRAVSPSDVLAIGAAVRAHVQTAFSEEAAQLARIETADSLDELAALA